MNIRTLCWRTLWKAAHEFVKNGEPTSTVSAYRITMRQLRDFAGDSDVGHFDAVKLYAFLDILDAGNLARSTANGRLLIVKQAFAWARRKGWVSKELMADVRGVEPLRSGRCKSADADAVLPVPEADVTACRPCVNAVIWDLIQLQLYTGMRPGEVTSLRACDIEFGSDSWFYIPQHHKTQHLGRKRNVALGPQAQAIVRKYLGLRPTNAYLFVPKSSDLKRYTTDTYRNAVRRGCVRAGIAPWHPHQLRHNTATMIAKRYDDETARAVLGHGSVKVTEGYIARDRSAASKVMQEVG